jgi:pantoate kinase
MHSSVAAFCPGHISGYFKRIEGRDAASTGSIGAGIVINEGVIAKVEPAEHPSIRIHQIDENGTISVVALDSPPIRYVMNRLSVAASVTTECHLPIGAGFGLSAAALLSTITALNCLFGLGMDETRIARAAHEAEIVHRTGLGDVAACCGGGLVVRTIPGVNIPVRRYFDIAGHVCAVSFGAIDTPTVLGSRKQMDRVTAAFPPGEPEGIGDFMRNSRIFAERSGLLTPQVKKVLADCDSEGVPASMTMLGNGVFAYGKKASDVLLHSGLVYELCIATKGPQVIGALP